MKNNLTTDELIERIGSALSTMSGQELADLYNKEFGSNMTYVGDDQFEQESVIDWTEVYDEGKCPDCNEMIIAVDGEACFNCGHVFTVPE